ncbi:GGDEF domain-containing protein [Deinococcus maricopensis]|uniref:Diguanylate cyclase n=1 Tax=Deinococcus maricopensis (strain DSM 21211 / LMG 22137 / NRRL B-23946 / LB-34) TaxID=709986 RepID=E8U9H1_DEIML|nr:GGDEF domain-containing protein [Deinococcus maricopensis]ADV67710.1 diguanylate cyclase [Deinococcus maricopensis DSM 21211]
MNPPGARWAPLLVTLLALAVTALLPSNPRLWALTGSLLSALPHAHATPLPFPVTAGLAALLAALAWHARGARAAALVMVAPLLALPAWAAGWLLPAVTLSLAALVGAFAAELQHWWLTAQLAHTDPLTGIGNRVAFTRALERRWAGRVEQPLGLIVVDYDGFRALNAREGRAAGDAALRALSAQLRTLKRPRDEVFRWDADRFALLLSGADERAVTHVTARVKDALGGQVLRVSVGGATTTPQMRAPGELVDRAARRHQRDKSIGSAF